MAAVAPLEERLDIDKPITRPTELAMDFSGLTKFSHLTQGNS